MKWMNVKWWLAAAIVMGGTAALALSLVPDEPGDSLMGARELLKKATDSATEGDASPSAMKELQERAAAFAQQTELPPEDAASQWMDLLRSAKPAIAEIGNSYSSYYNTYFAEQVLMKVLPGPEAWPLIREQLDAEIAALESPDASYLVLAVALAYLDQDWEAATARLEEVGRFRKKQQSSRYYFYSHSSNPEKADWMVQGLTPAEVGLEAFKSALFKPEESTLPDLPDVLEYAGGEQTTQWIRQALRRKAGSFSVEEGATRQLAQQMALQMMDDLSAPCWQLVDSSGSGLELFEALVARQEAKWKGMEENQADDADMTVEELLGDANMGGILETAFSGYLANGNTAVVKDWIDRYNTETIGVVRDVLAGWTYGYEPVEIDPSVAADVLKYCMAKGVVYSLLDIALPVMRQVGEAGQVGIWLDQYEQDNKDLGMQEKTEVQDWRIRWLLSMDRLDEAVAIWRAELNKEWADLETAGGNTIGTLRAKWLGAWYNISVLLARDDWHREVLTLCSTMQEQLLALSPGASVRKAPYPLWRLSTAMLENNDLLEVEKLLLTLYQLQTPRTHFSSIMPNLVKLYGREKRWDDVLYLLQEVPEWVSYKDVKEIRDIQPDVARALFYTGRKKEASTLIDNALVVDASSDWPYEIIMETGLIPLDEAVGYFDNLYARDVFEERPLIWKAEALRRLGRLDEAEAVARQALVVDPTDGEQRAGERVRGYTVLADILKEQGKDDEAEIFENVVRAVRVAERGDELKAAGLSVRALQAYIEASTYFPEAYCVQWRVASQFSATGQDEDAQRHYELAFEQMPGQFGRVATLCFGCMNVFDSKAGRVAAEKVLVAQSEQPDASPQVFFLLGQLRKKQAQPDAAIAALIRAVELDPQYMDAWALLHTLKLKRFTPREELEKEERRLMDLSPSLKHTDLDGDDILDWKAFWSIRQQWRTGIPPVAESYLPLTANAARLEKDDKQGKMTYNRYSSTMLLKPGEVFGRADFFSTLLRKIYRSY